MLACRPQTLHDVQGLAHGAWEYLKPDLPKGPRNFKQPCAIPVSGLFCDYGNPQPE